MKTNKTKRNIKKIEETPTCMCIVHLRNDGPNAIPCLGHGKDCPCTIKLNEVKEEPIEQKQSAE